MYDMEHRQTIYKMEQKQLQPAFIAVDFGRFYVGASWLVLSQIVRIEHGQLIHSVLSTVMLAGFTSVD